MSVSRTSETIAFVIDADLGGDMLSIVRGCHLWFEHSAANSRVARGAHKDGLLASEPKAFMLNGGKDRLKDIRQFIGMAVQRYDAASVFRLLGHDLDASWDAFLDLHGYQYSRKTNNMREYRRVRG